MIELHEKLNFLAKFKHLTEEQLLLLNGEEYEKALAIFEHKDRLIREFDESRGEFAEPELDLRKLKLMMQETQELNSRLTEKLRSSKFAAGMKLLKLQHSKKMESTYNYFAQTEGAFIDKKQ